MKISIDGLISCGKSTLLSKLQLETRIPIFLENVTGWTLLDKFYQDPERWGFSFNSQVILSMRKYKDITFDAVFERSINSCRWIFVDLQVDEKTITKEELDLFDELLKAIGWDQDVIIYLKTSPEICYERMQKRNRQCEETVSLEYLKKLEKKHLDMFKYLAIHKPHIKIFEVNGNDDEQTVYNKVLNILRKLIDI